MSASAEQRPGMERILIVDDDEELCDLVRRYLALEGFEVEAVHDGAQGVEKVLDPTGATPFDLIVLDVMLPTLGGLDVLRRLRERFSRTAPLGVRPATSRWALCLLSALLMPVSAPRGVRGL